ncbi:MAG: HAD hydrolase-like protein [Thermaerobacter sp.]|nr:HAD hydrolase-like protein [Thermaerobacter sp.]
MNRGCVLFDFDGTISLLRAGWQTVMESVMWECLAAALPAESARSPRADWSHRIREYIAASTGIQTAEQMVWLREQVERVGGARARSEWEYKDLYRRRLKSAISYRVAEVRSGEAPADRYLVAGSKALLSALQTKGFVLWLASGTDHDDLVEEAGVLGVSQYFFKMLGAPDRSMANPKAHLLGQALSQWPARDAGRLAVIGDGPVEMELARRYGALALGIASDEGEAGISGAAKQKRLQAAGAHAVFDDLSDLDAILDLISRRLTR